MERKYIIAIGALAVGLGFGFFVLVGQRRSMSASFADLSKVFGDNRQWVEIKPRIVPVGSSETEIPGKETKKASSGDEAEKIPAKEAKPAIKQCARKNTVLAQNKVIINEVAWMGTAKSYSDEWIELKNVSKENVNLNGWQLQNKNQKISVSFNENDILTASGFYLLERTDDETVPAVSADKIYSGNLGNSNEALYLFDADCQLQDLAVAAAKWPAGDNATKQTMERLPGLRWQTSAAVGGTPKAENK